MLQAHVEDLIKRDVKIAYLKNLQGYLWEDGYETGAYSTPLFADVASQLKQWERDGYQLAIYSSGSVFAQKLLFGHVKKHDSDSTATEDLQYLISNWFDTTNAGLKNEPSSYETITQHLKVNSVTFFTLYTLSRFEKWSEKKTIE